MSRTFVFNWKVTLFCAVFLVVFVNLGLWQLRRESEKVELLDAREALRDSTPITAGALRNRGPEEGVPVRLTGEFEADRTLLLDNRVLDGRVGFEVLQPFDSEGGRFLVNRGFVPMGRTRDEQPEIPGVPGRVSITGLTHEPGDQILLAEQSAPESFPAIVQAVDPGWIAAEGMYPLVIRLAEGEPGALPRHWPDVVMAPAQHRGYAIQWFAMALAVTLAWFFFSFRKEVDNDRREQRG